MSKVKIDFDGIKVWHEFDELIHQDRKLCVCVTLVRNFPEFRMKSTAEKYS